MKKRILMVVCATFTLTTLQPAPDPRSARARAARPNILLIVTDDQRVDAMSVMRATRKKFSDGGRRFSNAFATTPLCCPARASIFTGRYAHNHSVEDNTDPSFLDQSTTVQRYLKGSGYLTGIYGKYLNGWDLERDPPHFNRWAILEEEDYYGAVFNDQGKTRTVKKYSTNFIKNKAVSFIRSFAEDSDRRPWFLYLAPIAPHDKATPEPRYEEARVPRFDPKPNYLEEDRSDKPPWVQQEDDTEDERARFVRRQQLRTLMSVDDLVAEVLRATAGAREKRRTLAIFMSDNGYLLGEHGLMEKSWPYHASIDIPLYLRWPGRIRAGSTDARFAANIDIAPTILDAAGIGARHPVDGKSLLRSWTRPRILLEYFISRNDLPWAALRTRRYHYIEHYEDENLETEPRFREYYDLTEDPWELHNLLGDPDPSNDPDVESLHNQLMADRRCVGRKECP